MNNEPIMERWLHNSQSWKTSFILHITYYLHMANSTNFTYSRKLETNIQDVV